MHEPLSNSETAVLSRLEGRLGRLHARQRLAVETDHEARVCGRTVNFLEAENWYSAHSFIRIALRLTGLYRRGLENAQRIELRHNEVALARLPLAFDGYTLLHISDLHADMNPGAMRRLERLLPGLRYDACVLTGDFRGATFGPFDAALDAFAPVRARLEGPVYGVLGNHDTVRMVPRLEAMGIRMLINECATLSRGDREIYLAGIDDAHFYRLDNIEQAADGIPRGACSILLSHTPEIYRPAADADFDLLLSGHTHGGQVCLPGSIPVTLDSVLPRHLGAGAWKHHDMAGYTSVGAGSSIIAVRINCPPEITLHHLRCA